MQQYELLFILPGTLGESDVPPAVEVVRNVITEKGGTIVSLSDMGKSRLAYPMRHIRYGYFRLCRFEATNEQVVSIQQKLRLLKDVLRVLITKVDPRNAGMTTIQFAALPSDRTDNAEGTALETGSLPVNAAPVATQPVVEDKRIKLEDIDKKLDEILEKDITSQL